MTKTIIIARDTEENVWCASTSIKRIADFMNVSTTTVYRLLNNTDYYRGKKYEIKTGVELLTMNRGNVFNMRNREANKIHNNNIERKSGTNSDNVIDTTISAIEEAHTNNIDKEIDQNSIDIISTDTITTDKGHMNNITEIKEDLVTDTASVVNTDTTDTFDLF